MSTQMYDDRALGQLAKAWMTNDVAGTADDAHLNQILTATGRMRPQPRWLALLKEPQMRVNTITQVAVGSPARRPILVLAIIALLTAALVAAIVGFQLLNNQTGSTGDWSGFRGDATRSGAGLEGPVGKPLLAWQTHGDAPITKAIAIAGDLVYAYADDGTLHALSLADGAERWSAAISTSANRAGPAVVDGTVYAMDSDGRVHALGADDGKALWTSTETALDSSDPVIVNGSIYVGTGDGAGASGGELVALDASSGARRWRVDLGDAANNPATDGTSVYVGTSGAFVAVDAATGAERWRVDTGTDQTATAVVADGIAYIGASPEATTGHLRAIDAATGQPRWTIDEPLSSPTVANGLAYASDGIGSLVAIDTATGAIRWRLAFEGIARPSAVVGGVLYVPADGEHRIYALDAATGGELWRFDVRADNRCCIAVAKGSVFVGTFTGSVLRISGDGSTVSAAPIAVGPTVGPSAAPPASAAPVATPSAPMAEFVWRASAPDHLYIPPGGIAFDPDGRIWVSDPIASRFAIFERDGTFVENWGERGSDDGQFILQRENGDGYGMVAFAPDGSFYVLDVGNRRVVAFDADREYVTDWGGFGTDPGEYTNPIGIQVAGDGKVWVIDDVRGVAERYEPNGKVIGSIDAFSNRTPGFNKANSFTLDADGNLYVGRSAPNEVAKYSPEGELLATFGLEGPGRFDNEYPGQIAIDAQGRVFVAQGQGRGDAPGVIAFAADGTYIGGFGALGDAEGELFMAGGLLLDGEGNAFVLDFGNVFAGDSLSGSLQMFRLLAPLAP